MSDEPNKDTIAEIEAGGVRVVLNGPGVSSTEAYAIWQKVFDTVGNGRTRIGSGMGFNAERALPEEPSLYLGEGGPKVRSSPTGKPDCFHTWPGCNC